MPITSKDIQEIAGVVPDVIVRNFAAALGIDSESACAPPADEFDSMLIDEEEEMEAVRAGLRKPAKATGFDGVKAQVKQIMRNGYSVAQLISQVSSLRVLLRKRTAEAVLVVT